MSEKTEQPTPKKLRDARNKGQVANSKEVVSAALIVGLFLFLWFMADVYLYHISDMIDIPTVIYTLPFEQALQVSVDALMKKAILLLLPIVALVIVMGVFSNYLQIGSLLVFDPIKPKFEKISPVSGIKKIFSMKNLFEFIKSTVKIIFLSALIYLVIRNNLQDMINIPYCGETCLLPLIGRLFFLLMLNSIIAFLLIAAVDFMFQKAQHIKQLKMTKDEVKREYKDIEGNPEIKSRRKQIHRELLSTDMQQQVKKSSVIVTNPTHVAIGLYYLQDDTPLPRITVKGVDHVAKNIKAIAYDEGIPVMENVPLARALLAHSDVGDYIPDNLIEPVAQVMKWVKRLEDIEAEKTL